MTILKIITLLSTLFISNSVFAHEISSSSGFVSGFTHPVLGLDHLLAMLSVGILSLQMGGRSLWLVPSVFVIVMLVGGILGIQGIALVSVELGIALSVLVLGLAIAIGKKCPPIIAMLLVGGFALFHGHAHGTEMPHFSAPMLYALGFVIGTAVIHIAGIFIAIMASELKNGKQLLRYLGAGIAGIGAYLCI